MMTILILMMILAAVFGVVAFVPRVRLSLATALVKLSGSLLPLEIGAEFTSGDDDTEGDDWTGDDDILGALRRGVAPRNAGRNQPPARRPPTRAPLPQAGKPRPTANINPAALRVPMGIGSHTWAATHGEEITFEVEPQRDFTPDRMVVDFITNDVVLLNITSIKVGDMPQNPNDEVPMPAALFAKETTDAHVQFDTVKASRKLLVRAEPTAALAAMTSATASLGMFGWMVRGSQG